MQAKTASDGRGPVDTRLLGTRFRVTQTKMKAKEFKASDGLTSYLFELWEMVTRALRTRKGFDDAHQALESLYLIQRGLLGQTWVSCESLYKIPAEAVVEARYLFKNRKEALEWYQNLLPKLSTAGDELDAAEAEVWLLEFDLTDEQASTIIERYGPDLIGSALDYIDLAIDHLMENEPDRFVSEEVAEGWLLWLIVGLFELHGDKERQEFAKEVRANLELAMIPYPRDVQPGKSWQEAKEFNDYELCEVLEIAMAILRHKYAH